MLGSGSRLKVVRTCWEGLCQACEAAAAPATAAAAAAAAVAGKRCGVGLAFWQKGSRGAGDGGRGGRSGGCGLLQI